MQRVAGVLRQFLLQCNYAGILSQRPYASNNAKSKPDN